MQIKIITIPAVGGEAQNEELNTLLRSKKVLQVDQQLVSAAQGPVWCFSVRYTEDFSPVAKGPKRDFQKELEPEVFKRYEVLRNRRNELADKEGVKPYMIFTNEELAELAQFERLTKKDMQAVKGIGEERVKKYAAYFIPESGHEASE